MRHIFQPQHTIAISGFLTGELRQFRALRSLLRPESLADNKMGRSSQIHCGIALFDVLEVLRQTLQLLPPYTRRAKAP